MRGRVATLLGAGARMPVDEVAVWDASQDHPETLAWVRQQPE
jgi:hypothetical protein